MENKLTMAVCKKVMAQCCKKASYGSIERKVAIAVCYDGMHRQYGKKATYASMQKSSYASIQRVLFDWVEALCPRQHFFSHVGDFTKKSGYDSMERKLDMAVWKETRIPR